MSHAFFSLMLLQGVAEIDMLIDRLSASVRFGGALSDWILPLHSLLGPIDQRKVFESPPDNFRKVINPLFSLHAYTYTVLSTA
jgi:ATP-dependent RNA helicase DHX29